MTIVVALPSGDIPGGPPAGASGPRGGRAGSRGRLPLPSNPPAAAQPSSALCLEHTFYKADLFKFLICSKLTSSVVQTPSKRNVTSLLVPVSLGCLSDTCESF